MDNNTPASDWDEFRGRLFELIENRRPIAATFKYADIYFFVTRCRNVFISPDSDKGQEALDLIAQNGSFRLVAETWGDFLALFPLVEPPASVIDQSNQSRQSGEMETRVTRQPEGPKEDNQYNSQRTHRGGDHGEKPARTGSGRPF